MTILLKFPDISRPYLQTLFVKRGDILEKEKSWLKFIISGKPEDYIKYVNAKKEFDEAVNHNSLFDRRIGDKREQHWR